MVKTVTPFSSRAKEGATDSPLGDFVEVPQTITSTASAGFYDENGKLTGNQSTDRQWRGFTTHEEIPNGQTVLVPATDPDEDHINMMGFTDIFIGVNVSNAGSYGIKAVMGPDTNTFLGLTPVNSNTLLKGSNALQGQGDDFNSLLSDSAQTLVADVWEIFYINNSLKGQVNLQFQLINGSGGNSNIQFAYLRMV